MFKDEYREEIIFVVQYWEQGYTMAPPCRCIPMMYVVGLLRQPSRAQPVAPFASLFFCYSCRTSLNEIIEMLP